MFHLSLSSVNGGNDMPLTLPPLPYPEDSLEPYMSRETLEYHHGKHHLSYVTKANSLLQEKNKNIDNIQLEEVMQEAFQNQPDLFNNLGQHYNHIHFWQWMKPKGGGKIPGLLEKSVIEHFNSLEQFKKEFIDMGVKQFGSGWVWLVYREDKLTLMKTPNGENPLVHKAIPLLGCDVWEHSYYIDYRNRRPDYLAAFLDHLVNWEYVTERFVLASE